MLTILLTVACLTAAIFIYNSYSAYAQSIDQQIAGGYLRGHAGLYAAPRVIERGARLSKEQLVISLQRAGYGQNTASNIWSGSFEVIGDRIRIIPRHETGAAEWIDVTFGDRGTIASLSTNES